MKAHVRYLLLQVIPTNTLILLCYFEGNYSTKVIYSHLLSFTVH